MKKVLPACSVMPEEVISGLNIKKNGIYVDGTLGGGPRAWD